ncbi:MAG: hypothetical protein QE271_01265 [Bacteriovoracaceae bacterium]|nr:hypothetical protein [Bacteriovoracaceae bacterium]
MLETQIKSLFLIFFLGLSTSNVHSLDLNEKLNSRVVDYFKPNIIAIDRGSSDGINIRDHARIENKKGFVARGICVYRELHHSFWKIYRLHRPDVLEVNQSYKFTAIVFSDVNVKILQEVLKTKWEYLKDKKLDLKK